MAEGADIEQRNVVSATLHTTTIVLGPWFLQHLLAEVPSICTGLQFNSGTCLNTVTVTFCCR